MLRPRRRASPFSDWRTGRTVPLFCRMAPSRCPSLLPASNRSGLRSNCSRLLCRLLTSPPRSRALRRRSVRSPGRRRRSPEVRSTAFTARPPDLPPRPLMAVDFAIISSLVRPGRPHIWFLVRQVVALLHASFRPRLATTPLRFANPSPPSGWIEDFHLQAVDHARHTRKSPAGAGPSLSRRDNKGGKVSVLMVGVEPIVFVILRFFGPAMRALISTNADVVKSRITLARSRPWCSEFPAKST